MIGIRRLGRKRNAMTHVKCVVHTEWWINDGRDYYDTTNVEQKRKHKKGVEVSSVTSLHPSPFWEERTLKSIRAKLLWVVQGPQHIRGRGWILSTPPPVLFSVPQTRPQLSEARSIVTSTKDSLLRMKLSSPFGKVHSNSGSLQL